MQDKNTASFSFQITASQLLHPISLLTPLVASNVVVPILRNFLFDLTPGFLNIKASDAHTSVMTQIPVKNNGKGSIAVPGKLLVETLRNIPDQPVELFVYEKTFSMVIVTKNGRYQIACERSSDFHFPELPEKKEASTLNFSAEKMKRALQQTLFAVSKEKDHFNNSLTGINLVFNKEGVVFAATDGHRLVRHQLLSTLENSPQHTTSLPSKGMLLLSQLLSGFEGDLTLTVDEGTTLFHFGSFHFITKPIGGKYPAYEAIIPADYRQVVTIPTADLLSAVKIIGFYTNKTKCEIVLIFNPNKLTVQAEDMDFSNNAETKVPCHFSGDPFKVAVNAKLFLEMLKHIYDDETIIQMNGADRPIVIRPSVEKKEEKTLMLIMPLSLQQ